MLRRFAFQRALYFFNPSCSFASSKTKSKYQTTTQDENAPPEYNILQALRLTKAHAIAAFEETVEFHIK